MSFLDLQLAVISQHESREILVYQNKKTWKNNLWNKKEFQIELFKNIQPMNQTKGDHTKEIIT